MGDTGARGIQRRPKIAALERIMPHLALAIKSVSLARMTRTLMETYLGRDAGQRVLSGRIARGNAERIDAVVGSAICAGSRVSRTRRRNR